MIKRIENLRNKFLNEPDPAPGRSLSDDDGLAQLAQLQRNIRKRMGLTEDNPLVTPQRMVALLEGKGLQPSLVPGDDEAVIVRVGESDMTVVVSMMELKIFCRFDDLSEIGPSDEQVAVALGLARRWNQDFKALAVRLIGTRLNSDEETAEPAGPAGEFRGRGLRPLKHLVRDDRPAAAGRARGGHRRGDEPARLLEGEHRRQGGRGAGRGPGPNPDPDGLVPEGLSPRGGGVPGRRGPLLGPGAEPPRRRHRHCSALRTGGGSVGHDGAAAISPGRGPRPPASASSGGGGHGAAQEDLQGAARPAAALLFSSFVK